MCSLKWLFFTLLLLLLGAGGWGSYRVYDYIENDARFCNSCHIMNEAFKAWGRSAHRDVNCHECHQVSSFEGLRLVWVWFTQDPQEVTHKPVVKSATCASCHLSQKPQWRKVGGSVGHRIHFIQKKVECVQCHSRAIHRFLPAAESCLQCHSASIRGTMGSFHCSLCHDFLGTGPVKNILPGRKNCLGCHRAMQVSQEVFSEKAPMNFACQTCHAPHSQLIPSRLVCMDCHGEKDKDSAERFKRVFLHSVPAHTVCASCHKPHLWKLAARATCETCHADRKAHFPGLACSTCHKAKMRR